jgi:hypothetical protein
VHHIGWADETHKAEYYAAADGVLAVLPAPAQSAQVTDEMLAISGLNKDWNAAMRRAHEAEAKLAEIAADIEKLKDPVAVHINMLRGGIAMPSWAAIKHLYPEHFQLSAGNAALVKELRDQAIYVAKGTPPDEKIMALIEYLERLCKRAADEIDRLSASPQEARK